MAGFIEATTMGTEFFKSRSRSVPHSIGNTNLEARAIGANAYAGRAAAGGASKDLGAAMGINKMGAPKKLDRSTAYPKGPRI